MSLGPLKFTPVYKRKIWGGNNLAKVYNRFLPSDRVGESWDVSTHKDGQSIVAEPAHLAGKSLQELCECFPEKILGTKDPTFPLLVKIIDANSPLSVQVHPDNSYARKFENEKFGKNEFWYVLAAKPGAKIIYGLKEGTTKETFTQAIKEGKTPEYLKQIPVRAGDSFFVPAGTVHALGAGILIAEIQQSSNLVYRVFDWGRVDERLTI